MNEQLYHLRNTETGEIADTRYLNAELVETTNRRATDIPRFPWRWVATESVPDAEEAPIAIITTHANEDPGIGWTVAIERGEHYVQYFFGLRSRASQRRLVHFMESRCVLIYQDPPCYRWGVDSLTPTQEY